MTIVTWNKTRTWQHNEDGSKIQSGCKFTHTNTHHGYTQTQIKSWAFPSSVSLGWSYIFCRQQDVDILKPVMTFLATASVTALSPLCHKISGAWTADRWKFTQVAVKNVKLQRCGCASHLQLWDTLTPPNWKILQASSQALCWWSDARPHHHLKVRGFKCHRAVICVDLYMLACLAVLWACLSQKDLLGLIYKHFEQLALKKFQELNIQMM